MIDVVRAHWGLGSRMLADMFMPGVWAAERDAFARFQRDAAAREVGAELLRLIYASDVREQLPRVAARTLVVHRREDRAIPAGSVARWPRSCPPPSSWSSTAGPTCPGTATAVRCSA